MRIISSTGYGSTGSTAITDLLSEYEGIQSCRYTGYELKFFHNPRGIFNLYNNLVKSNIPTAKFYALDEYHKFCIECANNGTSMNYEKFFDYKFMEYTNEFIDELCGDEYYTGYKLKDINSVQLFIKRLLEKAYVVCREAFCEKTYGYNLPGLNLYAEISRYYLVNLDENTFLKITKKYFKKLFESFAKGKEISNIHELIPIQMIDECTRYFDDIRIICTERDPRDIYLNRKYRASSPFCDDVMTFCKHARWLRNLTREVQSSNILKIQFEDLVFHYDDTVREIERFCGLLPENHIRLKERFIPEKARGNCNLKECYPNEKENIMIIEKELSDLLYAFD